MIVVIVVTFHMRDFSSHDATRHGAQHDQTSVVVCAAVSRVVMIERARVIAVASVVAIVIVATAIAITLW